ncbi:BT_3987 domain-containing protein [Pontibacter oryzae]|uniref:DUF1735 domain-containing protein n=1 Tax=Pontibacter oryzae TaxID=2304593 RepID=A0A399RZ06_9BACT|nr:DUF1735 domain-containing protein [Pontibacter oryzae]RIJ37006.1 DUF1735 domain-containing protein [Pontibacter oryzae]
MKIKYKAFMLALALAGPLGLTSCLEDQGYQDFVDGVNKMTVVEFFGEEAGYHVKGLTLSETPQDLNVTVNIASAEQTKESITVKVEVDPAALAAYNAANKKSLEILPSSMYTIPSSTVTVPAGSREAVFTVKVKTNMIDRTKTYVLPLSITDAQGHTISGNFKTLLAEIKIDNKYAGSYTAKGVFNHPTAGQRDINRTKTLSTIDENTVETEYADLGGAGYKMRLVVNADNTVTIIPVGSTPATHSQFGENKYDPATKKFTLNYKYPGSGGDRVIAETITKK